MNAEEIYDAMTDDELPHAPYDIALSLVAGLGVLRAWGDVSITADHDNLRAYVGYDTVASANQMGLDTLQALASLGWGFDVECESFIRYV